MNHKKQGSSRAIPMAIVTVLVALILLFFPNLVSGIWKFLAWGATATGAVSAGVLRNIEKKAEELAEKELERRRRKRNELARKEREAQEERVQKAKEKAAQKEEEQNAKRNAIRAEMVKEAETVWVSREEYALEQEAAIKKVLDKTNQMPIRTAAGHVAIEWNEAAALAKWTATQIIMFTKRPDVTTKAREEAQDAIMEAARIKERGGMWTKEQGDELAKLKEKAKEEAMIEENRLDDIREIIEKADRKFKTAEARAKRGHDEIKAMLKKRY